MTSAALRERTPARIFRDQLLATHATNEADSLAASGAIGYPEAYSHSGDEHRVISGLGDAERSRDMGVGIGDALPVHSIVPEPGVTIGDLLVVEPLGERNMVHPPHRHDFAQLVLITGGSGSHLIDFSPVPIVPGEVHVVAPGQVHSWDAESLEGVTLIFSENLLDGLGGLPDPVRELLLLGAAPLRLSPEAQAQIRSIINGIATTRHPESAKHLVAATLWECVAGGTESPVSAEHSSLSREFLRLVLRAPSARMTVASCAAVLGVTSGYLAESVTAETGNTPGRILRTAVAREAQRLLSGTDLSAAQISERLGFSEATYFSRFFRREVGCTPTSYRELPPSRPSADA